MESINLREGRHELSADRLATESTPTYACLAFGEVKALVQLCVAKDKKTLETKQESRLKKWDSSDPRIPFEGRRG